ncbi:MAG: glycoside hydrolase family 127 protein [Chitinophagaceae bacterium]|nr:glycoside hydrolase family 127 protein [Chitinophagaceae bacterium]
MKQPQGTNKRHTSLVVAIAIISFGVQWGWAQQPRVQLFPLSAVRLLNSDFKQAQETDAAYILALDADRLLAPFLKEAGLSPARPAYGNWESDGLDGHTCGHYITALAQMAAATGRAVFTEKLHYVVAQLAACQQANGNGYVGGVPGSKALWAEIEKGNVAAIWKKWVPWYNIHKTYSGLLDAWLLTKNEAAKQVLLGMGEWAIQLTRNLTNDQMQQMLGNEYGGMNEVFAALAELTGDHRYLQLSERFAHRALLNPLLAGSDQLTGLHANTQIPKVIGFAKYGQVAANGQWTKAADFFWQTVVNTRTVAFGGNSVREHLNPATDFGPMLDSREGPETCNSYNMLKLTKALFVWNPLGSYLDYYERTLYNHILSSQHPKGGFVYFTPIHPQHYRVYSQPQQAFWCCVGSGIENHGKYGELIYAFDSSSLYLNLFIPSVLQWLQRGMQVTQHTRFPFGNQTELALQMGAPQQFTLKIRKPAWLSGPVEVLLNGKKLTQIPEASGYLLVNNTWKNGDIIRVTLPMSTRGEALPDGSPWLAFMHGPVLLAAATDTGQMHMPGLAADGSRWGHIAQGRLYAANDAPLLVLPNDSLRFSLPVKSPEHLQFSPGNFIYQEKYRNLTLVPFYKLHDARYMLYWPYTTRQKLPALLADLENKAATQKALEAATLDVVYPGEQQPEADHYFAGEGTRTGMFRERHYRGGRGWFSYRLRNPQLQAAAISFTCYGADTGRSFQVWLNDTLVQTLQLTESKGNVFYNHTVVLPPALKNSESITLLFRAAEGSAIPPIYEVRLLR